MIRYLLPVSAEQPADAPLRLGPALALTAVFALFLFLVLLLLPEPAAAAGLL